MMRAQRPPRVEISPVLEVRLDRVASDAERKLARFEARTGSTRFTSGTVDSSKRSSEAVRFTSRTTNYIPWCIGCSSPSSIHIPNR
jgi:hypothetical protein